jgi:hypothetical protein
MKKFGAKDRRLIEEALVPDVQFIADQLMELQDVDLDDGQAMVIADTVRRAVVDTALRTVEQELGGEFEPMGKKTHYYRESVVPDNGPNACAGCGITPHVELETVRESPLRKEDVGEEVAARLDQGMYASEDCLVCSRMIAMFGAFETYE